MNDIVKIIKSLEDSGVLIDGVTEQHEIKKQEGGFLGALLASLAADGAYVINLDDKNSKESYWVSLFIDKNTAEYFDSFGIEYIPHEVLNKIRDKSISHNIFRIQDNESFMCGFYCTAFIEYMLAGKTLLDYTNLFSLNEYKK